MTTTNESRNPPTTTRPHLPVGGSINDNLPSKQSKRENGT
jgi:hypothetical protein